MKKMGKPSWVFLTPIILVACHRGSSSGQPLPPIETPDPAPSLYSLELEVPSPVSTVGADLVVQAELKNLTDLPFFGSSLVDCNGELGRYAHVFLDVAFQYTQTSCFNYSETVFLPAFSAQAVAMTLATSSSQSPGSSFHEGVANLKALLDLGGPLPLVADPLANGGHAGGDMSLALADQMDSIQGIAGAPSRWGLRLELDQHSYPAGSSASLRAILFNDTDATVHGKTLDGYLQCLVWARIMSLVPVGAPICLSEEAGFQLAPGERLELLGSLPLTDGTGKPLPPGLYGIQASFNFEMTSIDFSSGISYIVKDGNSSNSSYVGLPVRVF